MYILSQVFVVISRLIFGLSYLTKRKNWLLALNIINNSLYGIHYLLLGSFTAAYNVFVTIMFFITMFILEKFKKEKYNFIVSIVCIVTVVTITCLTWSGPVASLIPLIAVTPVYLGVMFKNLIVVKSFLFFSTAMNSIFMFIISSYFGAALNALILIPATIGIIQSIKLYKKNNLSNTEAQPNEQATN